MRAPVTATPHHVSTLGLVVGMGPYSVSVKTSRDHPLRSLPERGHAVSWSVDEAPQQDSTTLAVCTDPRRFVGDEPESP